MISRGSDFKYSYAYYNNRKLLIAKYIMIHCYKIINMNYKGILKKIDILHCRKFIKASLFKIYERKCKNEIESRNITQLQEYETTKQLLTYFDPKFANKAIHIERDIQNENLHILRLFDKFAKDNNLQYWIDFGTLLGAIRHKGFVPWDNDADITLRHNDLVPLLSKMKEYFNKNNFTVRETDNYYHFQIRIIKSDNPVVGVDIFTVKNFYKNIFKTSRERNECNKKIKNIRHYLDSLITDKKLNGIDSIRNKISELELEINNGQLKKNAEIYYFGLEYPYTEKDLFVYKKDIFPLKCVKFENLIFPCPNNFNKRLSQLYGNYNQFPPKLSYE